MPDASEAVSQRLLSSCSSECRHVASSRNPCRDKGAGRPFKRFGEVCYFPGARHFLQSLRIRYTRLPLASSDIGRAVFLESAATLDGALGTRRGELAAEKLAKREV